MEKENEVDETMLQFVKPLTYKVLEKISQIGLPRPNLSRNHSRSDIAIKMAYKQGNKKQATFLKTTQSSNQHENIFQHQQSVLTSTVKPIKSI